MNHDPVIRLAPFAALQPRVLHGILKLRSDVFIVEQDCAYPDIDGRDAEDATRHLWIEDGEVVIAALRLLRNRDGASHIGRVVTQRDRRGRGLGAALMRHAISIATPPVELKAQSRLADWYKQFGFVACGAEFIEDGILHLPMRLDH